MILFCARFSANENIKQMLDEHCQITLPDNSMYVLKTAEELPEDYEVEKLPDVSFAKTGKIIAPLFFFVYCFLVSYVCLE